MSGDTWAALEALLTTDPRDAGCEETLRLLHVYVDLVVAGEDPERRLPGVTAHLGACPPCGVDFEGVLLAVRQHGRTRVSGPARP